MPSTLEYAASAAARDDAARTPKQYLRFRLGPDPFAVAIDAVREILQVGAMTALPLMPTLVRGVMNLRGAVVPVIDLAARLGQPPIQLSRRSCVVVVEAGHPGDSNEPEAAADATDASPDTLTAPLVVGLLVDAVYEVFDVALAGLEPVPPLGTRIEASFLRGMTRAHGEVIGVLALDRVLAQRELSALIANHLRH